MSQGEGRIDVDDCVELMGCRGYPVGGLGPVVSFVVQGPFARSKKTKRAVAPYEGDSVGV